MYHLHALLEANLVLYLDEWQTCPFSIQNINLSIATIFWILALYKLTQKWLHKAAGEWDEELQEADMAQHQDPNVFVPLDESVVDVKKLQWHFGRSLAGTPCIHTEAWKKYSRISFWHVHRIKQNPIRAQIVVEEILFLPGKKSITDITTYIHDYKSIMLSKWNIAISCDWTLIMVDHNEILHEYWYTNISCSQGMDNQVIDITKIFWWRGQYCMEQVCTTNSLPYICPYG